MQPYQEATEEALRKKNAPYDTAKKAVIAGVSFAGGVGLSRIAGRIAPFLSPYIEPELAKKGISRVDKGLGKFIDKSEQAGYDFDEIKQFIGEKISGEEPKQPEQNKNVIEKYSPELHQFISEQVKKGVSPLNAGAFAFAEKGGLGSKFKSVIKQMEKDHKTDWSSILQTVYGSDEQSQPGQSQQQPQQMQGQQQAQKAQLSQGLQALAQSIDELRKLRGG